MGSSILGSELREQRTYDRWLVAKSLWRDTRARLAALLLLFVAFTSLVVPAVETRDPGAMDLAARFSDPGWTHWLGADHLGRDIFVRLVHGGRVSLSATALAVAVAAGFGIPLGLLAGRFGGLIDSLFSRVQDALLALPPLILALAIIGALGPSLRNAMLAVGIIFSPRFFRLARASTQSLSRETFAEALDALGASDARILLRHILPNALGPLIVEMTIVAGLAMSAEASLSFLGLGVQPPTPSWGGMVKSAFSSFRDNSFAIVPPSVMLIATIGAFSQLGAGLHRNFVRGRPSARMEPNSE